MKKYNYIYKITNIINGKIYIGKHSTDDINDGYMGSGVVLRQAIKKYGIENFTKEYLAFCDTYDKLNFFERFYIRKYGSTDRNIGYNIASGGEGFDPGNEPWNKGKKGLQNAWNKGIPMTEEQKKKLSEAKKGKHYIKLSEVKKGVKTWNKGKTGIYSEETLEKLRKPKPKIKWITESGDIVEMTRSKKNRWHPDWKELKEDKEIELVIE